MVGEGGVGSTWIRTVSATGSPHPGTQHPGAGFAGTRATVALRRAIGGACTPRGRGGRAVRAGCRDVTGRVPLLVALAGRLTADI